MLLGCGYNGTFRQESMLLISKFTDKRIQNNYARKKKILYASYRSIGFANVFLSLTHKPDLLLHKNDNQAPSMSTRCHGYPNQINSEPKLSKSQSKEAMVLDWVAKANLYVKQ